MNNIIVVGTVVVANVHRIVVVEQTLRLVPVVVVAASRHAHMDWADGAHEPEEENRVEERTWLHYRMLVVEVVALLHRPEPSMT